MISEPLTRENELDIRKLFRLLWNGKLWIIGVAVVFAAAALAYSYLVKQEWVSVGVITKPSITALGPYYQQQQFLTGIGQNADSAGADAAIVNNVYQEFIQQLGAYDTRRDFWLQSDYYLTRKEGDDRVNTALLYEFIDNIRLTVGKQDSSSDSIQLIAETGADAQALLNQYIQYAADKTVYSLNQELKTLWSARLAQVTTRSQQLRAASDAYRRQQADLLRQSLNQEQNSSVATSDLKTDRSDAANSLVAPGSESDYYQSEVLLSKLSESPAAELFQPYRFLRTPDEPVKRSKPRRLFLLILWGGIGAFCGAGIALTRRKSSKTGYN